MKKALFESFVADAIFFVLGNFFFSPLSLVFFVVYLIPRSLIYSIFAFEPLFSDNLKIDIVIQSSIDFLLWWLIIFTVLFLLRIGKKRYAAS